MPGRFEEMSGAEWELSEDIFPGKAGKGRGMPAAHPRKALSPPLFISAVGCPRAVFSGAGNGHPRALAVAV